MKRFTLLVGLVSVSLSSSAFAQETVTYTYDAHGRLKRVERPIKTAHNQVRAYTYDKADNRINKAETLEPRPVS